MGKIPVRCICGKKYTFKATDENKRFTCRECGRKLIIEASEPDQAPIIFEDDVPSKRRRKRPAKQNGLSAPSGVVPPSPQRGTSEHMRKYCPPRLTYDGDEIVYTLPRSRIRGGASIILGAFLMIFSVLFLSGFFDVHRTLPDFDAPGETRSISKPSDFKIRHIVALGAGLGLLLNGRRRYRSDQRVGLLINADGDLAIREGVGDEQTLRKVTLGPDDCIAVHYVKPLGEQKGVEIHLDDGRSSKALLLWGLPSQKAEEYAKRLRAHLDLPGPENPEAPPPSTTAILLLLGGAVLFVVLLAAISSCQNPL